jgi:hypothetical protein
MLEFAVLGTALVLVALAVQVALAVGDGVYQRGRAAVARSAHDTRVTAVLTDSVPPQVGYSGTTETVTAKAAWRTPSGTPRTGGVQVLPPAAAGTRVTIWIDGSGDPTAQPIRADSLRYRQIISAAACLAMELMVLATLAYAAHRRFVAVRYAAWDREWRLIEPLWTDRLPEP